MNRHPAQGEADAVRAKYKEKSCSYGDACQTEGCLYWHPYEAAEAEDLAAAVEELHLEGAADAAVPTYEQWMAMNCPSPPNLDENYVYTLWHYPGSGMQRNPWDVYCLMYPQSAGNLNATSQTWEPSTNAVHAAPQSWEPAAEQQNDEPKSFQEWKKKGQPYPSWFCSDLDPWYDDEGVRRSLEEVYEVLYGPNAREKFMKKQEERERQAYEEDIANDPTPAELAAMMSNNGSQSLGTSPVVGSSTKGGWASVAAKRPASSPNLINSITNASNARPRGVSVGESSSSVKGQKRQTVVIPKEVWLPSTANSDCFHLYSNPMERFQAVNNHHKSYLASVTIPHCFDNTDNHCKGGKVTLIDCHFQSAKTIAPVLDRFLSVAVKKHDELWVVTGSGHHVAAGHQRRESGGVLFNAVMRYLEEREALDKTFAFKVGKDTSGGRNKSSGGAFVVRKTRTFLSANDPWRNTLHLGRRCGPD